jgi:hypothetical protein
MFQSSAIMQFDERLKQMLLKASFTFFSSVRADGVKLPLILMAKGKTDRCPNQLGTHPAYQCEIWHNLRGWPETMLVLRYPNWIRAHVVAEPITLILDQFDARDNRPVHRRAGELNIELIFIPRGGTIRKGGAENQLGWT